MEIKRYIPKIKYTGGEERLGEATLQIQELSSGEYIRYDDVSHLLAERDPTPVDAEWLDGAMGIHKVIEGIDGQILVWEGMFIAVWMYDSGLTALEIMGEEFPSSPGDPTRGDVLTALRLFGERK